MTPEMRAADLLGRLYAKQGRPLKDCPFDLNGSPNEVAKAVRFVRGYTSERPSLNVDYSDET